MENVHALQSFYVISKFEYFSISIYFYLIEEQRSRNRSAPSNQFQHIRRTFCREERHGILKKLGQTDQNAPFMQQLFKVTSKTIHNIFDLNWNFDKMWWNSVQIIWCTTWIVIILSVWGLFIPSIPFENRHKLDEWNQNQSIPHR